MEAAGTIYNATDLASNPGEIMWTGPATLRLY